MGPFLVPWGHFWYPGAISGMVGHFWYHEAIPGVMG